MNTIVAKIANYITNKINDYNKKKLKSIDLFEY